MYYSVDEAPDKIYLQILDEDGMIQDDVTWNVEQMYPGDVVYYKGYRTSVYINDVLGLSVARARRFKGLTQKELASLAGVAYSYIQRLESNKPGHTKKAKLDKVLGVLKLRFSDAMEGIACDSSIKEFVEFINTSIKEDKEREVKNEG